MGGTRLWWRYAFLAVQLIFFHKVSGKGLFQLRLLSFTNDLAMDIDGNCCDGIPFQTDRQCTIPCRTYFKVCLFNFVQEIRTDPFPKCTYGNSTTNILGTDSFEVPESEGLIELPFVFAWRNDFSLIVDAWHTNDSESRNLTQGSSSRLLERLAETSSRKVQPSWVNETFTTDNHKMEYSYRIVCEENFYGESCTRKCVSHDDITGHYTCLQNGSKLCLPGWSGGRCTIPICTQRCSNGRCVAPDTCQCTSGWSGEHCDQCIRSPGCQHGTCTMPNECKCDPGWGGVLCEIDTNHCTNHKPCQNGGTCRNEGARGYQCYCAEGFTGVDCEQVAVSDYCLNGGTPVASSSTPCICPPDTRGERCETYVPRCEPGRCMNGGSCLETQEGYTCKCTGGFVGANCETIDRCANRPCFNGGTCRNLLNGYACECPLGFAGATCIVDICENHRCFNGGSCIADFDGARCECPTGFEGEQCQSNVNDCVGSPCDNGGTCLDLVNNFMCTCALGYFGETCQKQLCTSSVNPCSNGGTCSLDSVGGFTCSCAEGFEGMFCENISEHPSLPAGTPDVEPTVSEVPNVDSSSKEDSNELLRIIKMVVFVVFGVLILLLLSCLTIVMCRKHRTGRTQRDAEGLQAPPNNRVIIDNFSKSEKELPLLSISEKVCNKQIEQDNLKATHFKEYTSVKNSSSNTLRKNSINSEDYKIKDYYSKDFECLQSSGETRASTSSSHEDCSVVRYVPQTRHSLPRNFDSEEISSNSDEFYYYDERNVALKRTDSLQTNSQSSSLESTPKHTAKCPILQISPATEESPSSTQVTSRHATEV